MFGTIRFVIATVFFLVIFAYALAPALSQVTNALQAAMISDGAATGVIGSMETALFLGMPLVMLGGVLLIGFVVATGLRGTSR
jgi:hypothetical protein